MEVGIREARNNLSKLVDAARLGEDVFLTRRGERVGRIVAAPKTKKKKVDIPGRGCLKDKINFYPGWDAPRTDAEIDEMFPFLREDR